MKKLFAIICAVMLVLSAVVSVSAIDVEPEEAEETTNTDESEYDYGIDPQAETRATYGGFTVEGDDSLCSYSGGVLTISGGNVTISDTTTTDRIVVTGSANITLSGVNITSTAAAFEITGGSSVTVTLVGSNTLTSGVRCAGLQKTDVNCKLIINGNGSLTANGGNWAAGIGGGAGSSGSYITIESGTVYAYAGSNGIVTGSGGGAGIGGGINGSGTYIKITGGTVYATGSGVKSTGGAGIGGGSGGIGDNITISGSAIVEATGGGKDPAPGDYLNGGGNGGAGIGGGAGKDGTNITINLNSDGKVTATAITESSTLFYGGAGIGGGGGNQAGSGENITIKGSGTVISYGGTSAAGIGGGSTWNAHSAGNGKITIEGSVNVTATGGGHSSAAIGGGGGGSNTKGTGAKGEVTITGGNVTTINGGIGSGIGNDGSNGYVNISGGTVDTTGIKGIYGNNVTISGGTVTTTGEDGEGIKGNNITISGGTVTAIGKSAGNGTTNAGIGGESSIVNIKKDTNSNSYPWVETNEIKSTNGNGDYWGIVFDEANKKTYGTGYTADGLVYGDVTLTEAHTLNGKTLGVPSGTTFVTNVGENNLLTLGAGSALYLEAGANPDIDTYKFVNNSGGKILHEDASKYDLETGICKICGTQGKPLEVPILGPDTWEFNDSEHWHICQTINDCSISHAKVDICVLNNVHINKDNGKAVHDFETTTIEVDGKLYYPCKVCNYRKLVGEDNDDNTTTTTTPDDNTTTTTTTPDDDTTTTTTTTPPTATTPTETTVPDVTIDSDVTTVSSEPNRPSPSYSPSVTATVTATRTETEYYPNDYSGEDISAEAGYYENDNDGINVIPPIILIVITAASAFVLYRREKK